MILAAGSIHSPVLLLRSGRQTRRAGPIGRHLTMHPGIRAYALFDDEVQGWRGAFQSYAVDHFWREDVKLITIMPPTGVITAGMPDVVGLPDEAIAERLKRTAAFGAMISDKSEGRVRRAPGGELVTYRMLPEDKEKLMRAVRLLADTFFEAGAREVYLPLHRRPVVRSRREVVEVTAASVRGREVECSAQHPLGTCRMGLDPRTSVVDQDHRVHGVPNLFVIDGSIVPTSVAVNPQITILGLATRAAWHLAADFDRMVAGNGR